MNNWLSPTCWVIGGILFFLGGLMDLQAWETKREVVEKQQQAIEQQQHLDLETAQRLYILDWLVVCGRDSSNLSVDQALKKCHINL